MQRLGWMMVLVAACGSDTSTGVSGQEAELHCRAWCDGGCGDDGRSAETCRRSCRYELARPCGEHTKAEHDCLTALRCSDTFNDCDHHGDEWGQCRQELIAYCEQCEGTPEQENACRNGSGECGSDPNTAECEYYVRAGVCSNAELELCLMSGVAYCDGPP